VRLSSETTTKKFCEFKRRFETWIEDNYSKQLHDVVFVHREMDDQNRWVITVWVSTYINWTDSAMRWKQWNMMMTCLRQLMKELRLEPDKTVKRLELSAGQDMLNVNCALPSGHDVV